MDTGRQWASILRMLATSKISIDTAARFAMSKPESAAELLGAIVARLQVIISLAQVLIVRLSLASTPALYSQA